MNEEEKRVLFRKKLGPKGEATGISIPNELLEYLEARSGDTLILCPDQGKYGPFISVWVEPEGEVEGEVEDGKRMQNFDR